jgi:hypothetical protein
LECPCILLVLESDMSLVESTVLFQHQNEDVYLFTLKNNNGLEVSISNLGAIIQSFIVPDSSGKPRDIVLGFDQMEHYTLISLILNLILIWVQLSVDMPTGSVILFLNWILNFTSLVQTTLHISFMVVMKVSTEKYGSLKVFQMIPDARACSQLS